MPTITLWTLVASAAFAGKHDPPAPVPAPAPAPSPEDGELSDMVRSLLDDLPAEDTPEDQPSEAEIINSFIRFDDVELDDRRARPVLGAYGGLSIPQHRLGPAPAGRVELGARLPWAKGAFTVLAAADGIHSFHRDDSDEPQPWTWTVTQDDLAVQLGAAWRMLGYREKVSPELGLAPELVFVRTTVAGGPVGASGLTEEVSSRRPGGAASFGMSVAAGPGYVGVVGTGSVTRLADELTGEIPQVRIGLGVGYRVVIVTSPPQGAPAPKRERSGSRAAPSGTMDPR